MHRIHCCRCSSDNVEYISDISIGCCKLKSAEVWHCNNCNEDMIIRVIYSEDWFDEKVCENQDRINYKDRGCD